MAVDLRRLWVLLKSEIEDDKEWERGRRKICEEKTGEERRKQRRKMKTGETAINGVL